jgi:hypothetical protein
VASVTHQANDATVTTRQVLGARDRFKVFRVAARAVATKVVNVKPARVIHHLGVHPAVNFVELACDPDLSVATARIYVALPQPATLVGDEAASHCSV